MYNVTLWHVLASCSGKAITITHSDCVCAALVIQHAMCMCHITICGLTYSTIFFHISHKQHNFRKKVIQYKMCVSISSTNFTWDVCHSKKKMSAIWSKMSSGLHVKYPLFLSDFNETWIFLTDFEKYTNIKFHGNPSSGSRVISCAQIDKRTDMTKLTVTFHNFASVLKNVMELTDMVSQKQQTQKKQQKYAFISDRTEIL